MNDIETGAEKEVETQKLHEGSLRTSIEDHWKAFERKQCELLRETGIALSEVLGSKHYQ